MAGTFEIYQDKKGEFRFRLARFIHFTCTAKTARPRP